MAEELEFVDGLIVKAPHERAPSFVKASISIKVEDLGVWLRAKHKAGEKWVNIDVKESRSGTWYAAVSNFKKDAGGRGSAEKPPPPSTRRAAPASSDDDMIPF